MSKLALRFPGIIASSATGVPYGLIDFGDGNSTKYYSIPHDAMLDLGAGAWAWGVWTKVDDNSGTAFQYILSSGVQPATPSFVLYLGEASASITAEQNRWVARIVDDAGVNTDALVSSAAPGADGSLRLIILQSTGTTVEMWFCEPGATAVRVVNAAVNLGALTAPVAWNLGRRSDGEAARYYEEWAGGLFKANAALSQANIESIAGGASPATVLGANLAEYWPFKNATIGTNETGVVASTVATYSAVAAYSANPVNFDGTNDYLTRGAGLTGAADSKLWTGSFWFRRAGGNGVLQRILRNDPATTAAVFNTSNAFSLFVTSVLDIATGAAITDTAWHHVMWSVDMADTAKRHLYLDGVSSLSVTTYANANIDFTSTNWGVGAGHDGTGKFNGDIADFQQWFGTYVDLSQAGNRELFIVAGAPVDPSVAAAFLGTPIVLLAGPTSTWHTNQGTGGGLDENGALTDGTGPVGL